MNYWKETHSLPTENFICGYCGRDISSNNGYYYNKSNNAYTSSVFIYICHHCGKPTYINKHRIPYEQIPGPLFGNSFHQEIFGEDQDVFILYEEARKCFSQSAYTSVGLCCRKLLMHIAVSCGAELDLRFVDYVNYLNDNNYIPVNAKGWVDIIRKKGNDANHEIIILNKEDAKKLIMFTQMIIDVIFRMKYEAEKYLEQEE